MGEDIDTLRTLVSIAQIVGTPVVLIYFVWKIVDRVLTHRQLRRMHEGESNGGVKLLGFDMKSFIVETGKAITTLEEGQEMILRQHKDCANGVKEAVRKNIDDQTKVQTAKQDKMIEVLSEIKGCLNTLITVLADS